MKLGHLLSTIRAYISLNSFASLILILSPMICCGSNVDSLEQRLNNTNITAERCDLSYEVFLYYDQKEIIDSIVVYGKKTMELCNINTKRGCNNILDIIAVLYNLNLFEEVDSLIDSISYNLIDPDLRLYFYSYVADDNLFYNNGSQFKYYWSKAEKALPESKDNNARAIYYEVLGFQNYAKGNLISALQSYKLASSFENLDEDLSFHINIGLGQTYTKIGELEKAKGIFKEAIIIASEKQNYFDVVTAYDGLIYCFSETKDYDLLLETTHKAIKYREEHNDNAQIGYSYYMLGNAHLGKSNIDSAKYYFTKGVELSIANNDNKELVDNYRGLTSYYEAIGDIQNAKLYVQKSKDAKSYFKDAKLDLTSARLWASDKNYKKAFNSLDKYIKDLSNQERDKKYDIILASQIMDESYQYRKEAEANIIESLKYERQLRNVILATVLGLIIISLILYLVYKNRKKLALLNSEISTKNKELDISIKKQNETIKYLENFAAVAAHDLKAPIRTASSFAGLLARSGKDKFTKKEQDYLNFIGKGVSQLTSMIDDLLSLSKLDSNLPKANQINLNDIVTNVESLLSDLLAKSNSKVIVAAPLPIVNGHTTLLTQLFQNIIKNSIVHNKTDNHTIIKIISESHDDTSHIIKISDNSGGIPDFMMPKLFDLFSSSDKNTGNGIGLAICEKVVKYYGGNITVDVNPGTGSTFSFTLPTI